MGGVLHFHLAAEFVECMRQMLCNLLHDGSQTLSDQTLKEGSPETVEIIYSRMKSTCSTCGPVTIKMF